MPRLKWKSLLFVAIYTFSFCNLNYMPAFAQKTKAEIESEFNAFAKKELSDCLADERISLPNPPLKKIDKCEVITGVTRDGTVIPCHKVANDSCEVQ